MLSIKSYKKIREKSYPDEKRTLDILSGGIIPYYIIRPLSMYITPIFISLKMSANTVSLFGVIPLITGMILIQQTHFFLGSILVNVWVVLDYVDGNIARYHNQSSTIGEFLDTVIGFHYHAMLGVAVGYGMYSLSNDIIYLICGGLFVISNLMRRCISLRYTLATSNINKNNISPPEKIPINTKTILRALPIEILEFETIALLLAVIFSKIDLWLYFYTGYNVITYFISMLLKFNKLQSFNK